MFNNYHGLGHNTKNGKNHYFLLIPYSMLHIYYLTFDNI